MVVQCKDDEPFVSAIVEFSFFRGDSRSSCSAREGSCKLQLLCVVSLFVKVPRFKGQGMTSLCAIIVVNSRQGPIQLV